MLLALDTSTTAVTVAVVHAGEPVTQRTVLGERRHGALLAPLVREVLDAAAVRPAALDSVVVGVGPGPYTSLRVGVMTAQALGRAAGVPVRGVCSHDAIAAQVAGEQADAAPPVLGVATDAKRREVFASVHHRDPAAPGGVRRSSGPLTTSAAALPDDQRVLPTAGRGPLLHPDDLPSPLPVLDVSAAWLGRLAELAMAAGDPGRVLLDATPLYLRRPDAVEAAPRVPVGDLAPGVGARPS